MDDEIKKLLNDLKSEDESDSRYAAEDLGDLDKPGVEVVEALLFALEDNSVGVKEASVESLINIGGSKAILKSIKLLNSENCSLRNYVQEIIIGIGEDSIPHVLDLLDESNYDVKIFALNMLCKLHLNFDDEEGEKNLAKIAKCLDDQEENVASAAAEAFSEIGSEKAIGSLLSHIERGGYPQYCMMAAIIHIQGENARDVIEKLIEKGLEPEANDLALSFLGSHKVTGKEDK